ncbi:hypothetical protein J3Q64DRAFT_1712941 [Phycomyces blakesleeanus]|uniref:EamA domain-containing protein n=2 Tax=Phycomyces blakesleeanus TaxID=4837 RepID=A0A162N9F1_PHYB8|nr:hypothetical protein PHYBLDRAFT_174468 [Phycomyces blakesleeanus NRRL 1555(-)]OAD67084.1 hypothetical protein PHYBLDRAFT_174468 [Phycomyces blakesleeanus NRRL 1555(-)]|eukprot:XP_018285124.1 hypothetical protein PHYBLDRAFT_174468 [Phycomyces blakesleeanus NRRL 1555(-)]
MANVAEQHLPVVQKPKRANVQIVNEATSLMPSQNKSADLSLSLEPTERRKQWLGLIIMGMSAMSFSCMAMLVRISAVYFSIVDIVLARSATQLVLSLASCAVLGINPLGKYGVRKWLFFRALVGSIGLILFFYSLTRLPMLEATSLFFLGPTFTAIVSYLVLNEPYTLFDGVCSVGCLFGIILVWKPKYALGHPVADPTAGVYNMDPSQLAEDEMARSFAILCAVAGAIMSAIAYISVRKVGKGTHLMVHSVYFAVISCVLCIGGVFVMPPNTLLQEDWSSYTLLGLMALFSFAGQCFLNQGVQMVPAGLGALMRICDIVFAYLSGVFVLHEYPDSLCVSGVCLIVGMTTTLSIHKWQVQKIRALELRKQRSRERV